MRTVVPHRPRREGCRIAKIHPGAAEAVRNTSIRTGDVDAIRRDVVVVVVVATNYGSLPLRPCREDDGFVDIENNDSAATTVSSLSTDGDIIIDHRDDMDDGIVIKSPSRHRKLLRITMIALPLFMALVLLHELIQQQHQVLQRTNAVASAQSLPSWMGRRSIVMYGRANADGNRNGENDDYDDDDYDRRVVDDDITFANLAARVLPAYLRRCIEMCISTIAPYDDDGDASTRTSVLPGEVATLRKTILKTRDLFDVFSPVYPDRSVASSRHAARLSRTHTRRHDAAEDDVWSTMRDILAGGYRLIGEYQDLDHASILYGPSDLIGYQTEVWSWHVEFMKATNSDRIFSYLSSPCGYADGGATSGHRHRCRYLHRHVSHLFWGHASYRDLPIGDVDGATVALAKLGNSQLERAGSYLRCALTHEHVLNATTGADATGSDLSTSMAVGEDKVVGDDVVTVHEIYHNARKELRSFLDLLALFGDMLLPGYSSVPEISILDPTTADAVAPRARDDPATGMLIDRAVDALESARKMLGDLNDEYSAYEWYRKMNEYPEERSRLMTDIEMRWGKFRAWQKEADLSSKIDLLRRAMMHPDLMWTFDSIADLRS
jgi:hypothetical protein